MAYTYKSLTLLWLVTSGLFALTASGLVADSWLFLVLAVALAAPALILTYDSRKRLSAQPAIVA